ncbi:hypothetical protein J6590_090759 [Homalodisca vitripennis]|nr:hypothetical protein J6590_090759 [Homalodisca vitripennis]
MEGINTELLIDEVKKREAIWNSSSETYKDRVLKKNQWSQLCSIFCSNFEDQTPKEKAATFYSVVVFADCTHCTGSGELHPEH